MTLVVEPERRLVLLIIDQQPRCWRCGRMIAWLAARPWRISCGRCKALNSSEPEVAEAPRPRPIERRG